MIKSREKLGGHVTCVRRIAIGYKILSRRRESEVYLGEIEEDGKIGLKMHLIENNFKLWIVLNWINLDLNYGITSIW
jgi:hypothetical protein